MEDLRVVTKAFYEMEKLIYSTVYKVQRQLGGEFDELKSEAFLAFVKMFDETPSWYQWDGKRKLSTWTRWVVYHHLFNFRKKEFRAQRLRPEDYHLPYEYGNLAEILSDLEEDARTIVDLIFDTPQDLLWELILDGGDMDKVMEVIAKYIRSNGWNRQRLAIAYKQIIKAVWAA